MDRLKIFLVINYITNNYTYKFRSSKIHAKVKTIINAILCFIILQRPMEETDTVLQK